VERQLGRAATMAAQRWCATREQGGGGLLNRRWGKGGASKPSSCSMPSHYTAVRRASSGGALTQGRAARDQRLSRRAADQRGGARHVAGEDVARVLNTDRWARARLGVRTAAYAATSPTSRRAFAFRHDCVNLGHFDYVFLPSFELKCIKR
jgi:hypothetical protein